MFARSRLLTRKLLLPMLVISILCSTALLGSRPASEAPGDRSMPSLQGQAAIDYLKRQDSYQSLKESIRAARYEIEWNEKTPMPNGAGAYRALNPEQNYVAYLNESEVQVAPIRSGDLAWRMGMKIKGFGYGERLIETRSGLIEASGNRIEIQRSLATDHRPLITEWYVNKPEGLEQGFTVLSPPELNPQGERLRVVLELAGDLRVKAASEAEALSLENEDGQEVLIYDHLVAQDATGKKLPARMKASGREVSIEVEDRSAVYPVIIDPTFTQTKKLISSDGAMNDFFGSVVAISGDTVVVGAEGADVGGNDSQGAAYVFERNQGGANQWEQVKKLVASDGVELDFFGTSVAINNDTIVVGAPFAIVDDDEKGAAYIFQRNQGGANNWGEVKKLTGSDSDDGEEFGHAVGISGDTIVVGAPFDNVSVFDEVGAAYVFERNQEGANQWGETQQLTASDGEEEDAFGDSVAINGDTIVVGATGDDESQGSAYVFERNQQAAALQVSTQSFESAQGEEWAEVKKLTASDGDEDERFGESVAVGGDTIVVGAPFAAVGSNSFQGAAYIFERNEGGANQWGETQKLAASDGANGDIFGISVAISNDMIVVGAAFDDIGSNNLQGSAYIFERDQQSSELQVSAQAFESAQAGDFEETQKLTASDGAAIDFFALSAAISGNTIVAGAGAADIGGIASQGSAYVFDAGSDTDLPPTITPGSISRQRGAPASVSNIATVGDDSTPADDLVVTVNSSPQGISVTNISNTGGTITANVAADCTAALGDNLVELKVTDQEGLMATANLTVNVTPDTTPPTIACPPNQAVAVPPSGTSAVVNYANPTVNDNCPTNVVCTPPSGSSFPVGTTTVTCTATDAAGNTANCSFTVNVTGARIIRDDSSGNLLVINDSPGAATATYQFFDCKKGITLNGTATIIRSSCKIEFKDSGPDPKRPDRKVLATINPCTLKGNAMVQIFAKGLSYTLNDSNVNNNPLGCQ